MGFGPEAKNIFPTNKIERKRALADAQKQAEETRRMEPNWGCGNSPLQSSPEGPPHVSFEGTFRNILPDEEKDLKRFIEATLRNKAGKAVGIEFGGPGSELFAGFSEGFFKKTFGIALNDARDLMRPDPRPRDAERKHTVIEGNMFSPEVYVELTKKLSGDGVDVILERMFGGLETVPREPLIIAETLQRWYGLLNEGGMLFVQVPREFARFARAWDKEVLSKVPTIQIKRSEQIDRASLAFPIYLRKLRNAPTVLPLLDPKTVAKISRRLKISDPDK